MQGSIITHAMVITDSRQNLEKSKTTTTALKEPMCPLGIFVVYCHVLHYKSNFTIIFILLKVYVYGPPVRLCILAVSEIRNWIEINGNPRAGDSSKEREFPDLGKIQKIGYSKVVCLTLLVLDPWIVQEKPLRWCSRWTIYDYINPEVGKHHHKLTKVYNFSRLFWRKCQII